MKRINCVQIVVLCMLTVGCLNLKHAQEYVVYDTYATNWFNVVEERHFKAEYKLVKTYYYPEIHVEFWILYTTGWKCKNDFLSPEYIEYRIGWPTNWRSLKR